MSAVMAKKQRKCGPARRQISLRREVYDRLSQFAELQGRSRSGLCEDWIAADLDARGIPVPDASECTPARPKGKHPKHYAKAIFTW